MAHSRDDAKHAKLGQRRLLAIMFTDLVGYSELAHRNEALALELLEEHRQIVRRIIPTYGGYENKTIGDAFFIEFGSAVEAVRCAIEIQRTLFERNSVIPKERRYLMRIGLHLGDVVENEGDSLGDGVNIASRIEPLAFPGGICMTRQIYDQVEYRLNLKVRKLPSIKLKKMSISTQVFRVVMPWEETGVSRLRHWLMRLSRSPRNALSRGSHLTAPLNLMNGIVTLGSLAILILAGLVISGNWENYAPQITSPQTLDEIVRSQQEMRVDLSQGWEYKVFGSNDWLPFDTQRRIDYSDKIQGRYWLRKTFNTTRSYTYPSIVLGLISRAHRVELNGNFIGGSNYFGSVTQYSFDNSLLRPIGGLNELVVTAHTPETSLPGIWSMSETGSFLGEFTDVNEVVIQDWIHFHLARNVYFWVSLLLTLACLGFYIFNASDRRYLYFATYLLMGSLLLLYYNTFSYSMMNHRFHRFIKVFSLGMANFSLFSAYFYIWRKEKSELLNTAAMITFGIGSTWLLLSQQSPLSDSIRFYNHLFTGAFAYSCLMIAGLSSSMLNKNFIERRITGRFSTHLSDEIMILTFATLSTLVLASSIHSSPLSEGGRKFFNDLGIGFPFFFSLVLLARGIYQHIVRVHSISYQRKRENLILSIVSRIKDRNDLSQVVAEIQDDVCRFIHAEKSTLFLMDQSKDESCLKVNHQFGTADYLKNVQKTLVPDEGAIAYIYRNRSPLLIDDIREDLRFSEAIQQRKHKGNYKTGSCMLFPLMVHTRLVGILTVSDKKDGSRFTPEEFTLMHIVCKDLAILIDNYSMQNQLLQKQSKTA